MVMLTYVLKNVNYSNDSRASKRDVKSFSSQYELDGSIQVFDASLIEETPNRSVLIFGNHFYHGCFLHYFEGCPRVSSFHLHNLDYEAGNEL